MSKSPIVLIEVGDPDLPNPVVTKDERVTTVTLTWDEEMEPELIEEAWLILNGLRGEHPRFAVVLDRLEAIQGGG